MSERATLGAILPYFGGKRNLAPTIVARMRKHRAYWELCCGSLAILFAKPKSSMEVVCDRNGAVCNLARVLADRDQAERLYERLLGTLMCSDLFDEAKIACKGYANITLDDGAVWTADAMRDWAYWYLVESWMGRNGVAGTPAVNTTWSRRFTSNGGAGGRRWAAVAESIPAWHERLREVQIERADLFDIVTRIDDAEGTTIYIDPPYVEKGAKYIEEFAGHVEREAKPCDHCRLAAEVRRFTRAQVIVSYYEHPLVRRLYAGWRIDRVEVTKALSSAGERGRGKSTTGVELIISNDRAGGGLFEQ